MNAVPQPVPFEPATQWPDPDMNIGQPSRPAPPVMSDEDFEHVFGPWANWIKDAAEVKNAPVDYVMLTLLSVASAAIGNSRWAVPWDGWKEPPILWTLLVGDPSAGKSPALDSVLDPVKEIERGLAEEYRHARDEWESENEMASFSLAQWKQDVRDALKESADAPAKPTEADAGPSPVRERINITDITTEEVAHLLSATWRGLLLSRDELSGWLSSMDRYNGGGDRPFWLETFGGRSYTIDRRNHPEPIVVDHLSVAITGGTQPDKLSELLVKSSDDGLLARFMVVFPDPVPIERPASILDEARMVNAISRLRSLQPALDEEGSKRPYFVHLSEPAANVLQDFRKQVREWEADATELFKSHIGKMPGLVVRVACVLAHLDWAASTTDAPPSAIENHHMGRACDLVGDYLRQHAYRAYGTARAAPEVEGAKAIARIILEEQPSGLKVRDIQHRNRTGLGTAKQVMAAFSVLMDADWLREIRTETGGRPSVVFAVNPKLGG
ncbi:YfjI family protein [Ruegeria lacuscaerulensis]|uniref:YfjI family protein n=1 Tax=Ruegeria lacuscaerulensis TaxID=55218 RepID=UPI00147E5DB8|nr:YfjI family protein [Ruegeria lacuscaerulensis]